MFSCVSLFLFVYDVCVCVSERIRHRFKFSWQKVVKASHFNSTSANAHKTTNWSLGKLFESSSTSFEENPWFSSLIRIGESEERRKNFEATENVANYTPLCSDMLLNRRMFIYAFSTREEKKVLVSVGSE